MNENYDNRIPPNHLEAEKSVLGCCMVDEEMLNRISAFLEPGDFYQPTHRIIYQMILDLSLSGKPVDQLTVSVALEKQNQLEKCGGQSYIMSLPDQAPLLSNGVHYAKLVKDSYLLRRLLNVSNEIKALCYTDASDTTLLLDQAAKKIFELRGDTGSKGMESFGDILERTVNEILAINQAGEQKNMVKSGFQSVDQVLNGGYKGGTLNIVAARPGMGKSAYAVNVALHAAMHNRVPVVIFSLEMSKEDIVKRIIAGEANIDGSRIQSGQINDKDYEPLSEVLPILHGIPLYVDDRTSNTPMEMLAKCRQLKMEKKCGMIIIDYMQLMISHKKTENRQQEISDISRSLKVIAKELNVPVIALSQLSRAVETRKQARPMLSDLRESGSIEQDADSVMFIYRPDYYSDNKDFVEQQQIQDAELIFAKNRAGSTKSVQLGWIPKYTKFMEKSFRNEDDIYVTKKDEGVPF